MELKDTVQSMLSPDYKERFKAEYSQLYIRLDKLNNLLKAWDEGKLDFVPSVPRDVYDSQVKAMEDYLNILLSRSKIEGVDL